MMRGIAMFKLYFIFILSNGSQSPMYAHSLFFETEQDCEQHAQEILPERFSEFGDSHHGELSGLLYKCEKNSIDL